MRISPLTETGMDWLEALATGLDGANIQIHITTTELSYALGVSQDTIKRRLNRERDAYATRLEDGGWVWDSDQLPKPIDADWLSKPAEWDLVVVLRWLAQRPMRRQV